MRQLPNAPKISPNNIKLTTPATNSCSSPKGATRCRVNHCFDEHGDAKETQQAVKSYDRQCLLIPGDIRREKFCQEAVQKTVAELGISPAKII
jgi:hypothetical protein